jgi:hypothetical protein
VTELLSCRQCRSEHGRDVSYDAVFCALLAAGNPINFTLGALGILLVQNRGVAEIRREEASLATDAGPAAGETPRPR